MQPKTRYAKSDDVHIAYQVVGDGPIDLVFVPGWVSHLEHDWEWPPKARVLHRLASFSRLIRFDKRGTGLSDRVPDRELPTLEQRLDDVRAVMDAVGSEKTALFGFSEGGPISVLFAATYPERTTALVLYGAYARRVWAPDHPWAQTAEQREEGLRVLEQTWGEPGPVEQYAPSMMEDAEFLRWVTTDLRLSASPGAAIALGRMNSAIDVRHVLPAVRVPTLILHRTHERVVPVESARYMAERIPGAKLVELPGADHQFWFGDSDTVVGEIEEFLTGVRPAAEPDRILATVLFTDIVSSTERAAMLGDRRWRELLDSHNHLVRRELAHFRGREIHTAGDGFLATFDGPARAIRCASAIRDAVRRLGIEIRAGLHTGEIELMGDDVGGIAVHIGARVAAEAGAGEVLVSSTVKDLVAGSGLEFEDRGAQALKGVPGEWRVFAVVQGGLR